MPKLWQQILAVFQFIGDTSGCHQIPERCIRIKSYTFPLCARCTGVFIGQLLCLILLFFNIKISIICAIIFLFIMGLDWFLQYLTILESTNVRRLITGILGGYAVITFYYYILKFILSYFNITI